MSEDIYRKKSLDRVKSPENLDDYIRVSNPGVWLLLVSIILILAGACVWGTLGHIDSVVETLVIAEDGDLVCRVEEANVTSVSTGMTVRFNGREATVSGAAKKDGTAFVFPLQSEEEIADGVYDGRIVTESVSPMSFILN